jgi:hypothetical protein
MNARMQPTVVDGTMNKRDFIPTAAPAPIRRSVRGIGTNAAPKKIHMRTAAPLTSRLLELWSHCNKASATI